MSLAGLLIIILLAGGCADVPSIPSAGQTSRQEQADAAVQDAKAESAALRADLASARITAAKQEAELRELRRQADELRQVADARHTELVALRNERDRLAQTSTIAQVGVADPAALPASAADVVGLRAKLHEMESALAALTAELAQVRKEMTRPSPQPSPRKGEGAEPPPASSPARGEDKKEKRR